MISVDDGFGSWAGGAWLSIMSNTVSWIAGSSSVEPTVPRMMLRSRSPAIMQPAPCIRSPWIVSPRPMIVQLDHHGGTERGFPSCSDQHGSVMLGGNRRFPAFAGHSWSAASAPGHGLVANPTHFQRGPGTVDRLDRAPFQLGSPDSGRLNGAMIHGATITVPRIKLPEPSWS